MTFNKFPTVKISPEQDNCILGWDNICNELKTQIKE